MTIITARWIKDEELIFREIIRDTTGFKYNILDLEDFIPFPMTYISFDCSDLDELIKILPEYNYRISKAVLSFTSCNDLPLVYVDEIQKILLSKYGDEMDIIYGFKLSKTSGYIKVNLFVLKVENKEC